MSGLNKDSLIPIGSLLAGVIVTCAVAAWWRQPPTQVLAAMERFRNLSAQEQTDIHDRAKSYVGNARAEDRQRTAAIHQAVQEDPAMLTKLKRLKEILETADEETQARLRPNGEFAENWVTLVESFHRERSNTAPMIEIRMPSFSGPGRDPDRERLQFSEQQFETFLGAVIPVPPPPVLQKRLETFSAADRDCERTLAKTLWLIQELRSDAIDGLNPDVVTAAALEYLIDTKSPAGARMAAVLRWKPSINGSSESRNTREETPRRGSGIPAERQADRPQLSIAEKEVERQRGLLRFQRTKPLMLLKEPLRHYEARFNAIYQPTNNDLAELFGKEMKRDGQLALMKMDPADAEKELLNESIERIPNTDQAVVTLISDLQDANQFFREKMWEMSRGMRGSRGGFNGRGSGRRTGSGRDDNRRPPPDDSTRGPSSRPRDGQ